MPAVNDRKSIAWYVRSGDQNMPNCVVQPPKQIEIFTKLLSNQHFKAFPSMPKFNSETRFKFEYSSSTFQGEFKYHTFKAYKDY